MTTTARASCFTLCGMGRKTTPSVAAVPAPLPMLRIVRKELGKTQEWLADEVGLTKASISRIEKGEQNWDAAFLRAAAAALGVEPADLLTKREPKHLAVLLAMRGLTPASQQVLADMAETLKRNDADR